MLDVIRNCIAAMRCRFFGCAYSRNEGYWVDWWGVKTTEGSHDAYMATNAREAYESLFDGASELKPYFDEFDIIFEAKDSMLMAHPTMPKCILLVVKKTKEN
jgi:hypothetical protein